MTLQRVAAAVLLLIATAGSASATWSIVAVDRSTRQIVVASATCLPQAVFAQLGARDLRDIQAAVVPGKGAAVGQSLIDTTRRNQKLLIAELAKGTEPAVIVDLLRKTDAEFEARQFGIVDLQGRSAGFTGKENQPRALAMSGTAGGAIHFQVQGNILADDSVVRDAGLAITNGRGGLPQRVMAAMEAADARGGDRRCRNGKTSLVAYLLIVDERGNETYIQATDADPGNPVVRLRERFDALAIR